MASIKGLQIKNLKSFEGPEDICQSGTLYYRGKKIGTFLDKSDDSTVDIQYVSEADREKMIKVAIEWAKTKSRPALEKCYQERKQVYQEICEDFRKENPFIPEEDITVKTMANWNVSGVIRELIMLMSAEQYLKNNPESNGVAYGNGRIFYLSSGVKKNDLARFCIENNIQRILTSPKSCDFE